MLEHLNKSPQAPQRIVVMGAGGFVGGAIVSRAQRDGIPVLSLGHRDIDLLSPGAADRLASLLKADDAFVAVSALAPCKTSDTLVQNMVMANAMIKALTKVSFAHVVNISSDAVYADSPEPLTESSAAAPTTLHGAMHLAREVMFLSDVRSPLTILRPSLLYGASDPHNGYGPNRFRRLAAEGKEIVLFGEGEERRDHVFIDDVAELVLRVIRHRSNGVLNIATGAVHSFRSIAEKVVQLSGKHVAISASPRVGSMPHNGYRPFRIDYCKKAFPDFQYTSLADGLAKAQHGAKRSN